MGATTSAGIMAKKSALETLLAQEAGAGGEGAEGSALYPGGALAQLLGRACDPPPASA